MATAAVPVLDSIVASWRADFVEGLPDWFIDRQRRALDVARASLWPNRGDEDWKYTSLQTLARTLPMLSAIGMPAATEALTAPGLAFAAGRLSSINQAGLSDGIELESLSQALREDSQALRFTIGREPDEGDVFDHLNTAFAVDGACLRVANGSGTDRWLTLRSRSGKNAHWHLAHRIDVGENARLRLCIDLSGIDDQQTLATVATRIRVQRGGRLDLAWIVDPGNVSVIARTRIDLEQNARLQLHALDAGAAPSRHDLRIHLRGEGADAQLGGVFMVDGTAHADTQLDVRHEAPKTSSRTTWRVVTRDRSRAVFSGRIVVQSGADGADARLACKSLLLSAQAEVDVKPVLEIHADDVRCAHGATVGQIDQLALFYLRSRGLDESLARGLLLRAFASEALAGIGDSPVVAVLDRRLDGITA